MTPLHLQELRLFQFKSHLQNRFTFKLGINALVGANGVGKTNILEALHYLTLTRSFLSGSEHLAITEQNDLTRVNGIFNIDEREFECDITIQLGKRKIIRHQGSKVPRLKEHYGLIPFVFVGPGDISLIHGSAEERRRFMDMAIGQSNTEYLETLQRYQKTLDQRNHLLRVWAETGRSQADVMEGLHSQLEQQSNLITKERIAYISELQTPFFHFFQKMAGSLEFPEINYISRQKNTDLLSLYKADQTKDLATGRTHAGPHRDDIDFLLKGHSLRYQGSQGQQKSFLLALKLAQWQVLANQSKKKPLLALDDIFERLDERRTQALMELLGELKPNQIFLTDSNPERTQRMTAYANLPVHFISL